MGRLILLIAAAVVIAGGAALYHFVFSPHRTQVVEGYTGPANAIGVSPRALSETALIGEVPGHGLDDRIFRTRFWSVNAGGVVPIHTHTGRPAIVYILQGEIQEFRNGAETPELHHQDEISAEGLGVVHYWRNESNSVVHLWANDLYLREGPQPEAAIEPSEAPMIEEAGVAFETLTQIELAGEEIGATAGVFRVRRLTIAPGGRTAVNLSGAAPYSTYVTVGELQMHRAGQADAERQVAGADTHIRVGAWAWWENTSDAPATLIAADIDGLDTAVVQAALTDQPSAP